jgi:hypothetical protein
VMLPDGRLGWVAGWLVDLNVDAEGVQVAASIPTRPAAPSPTAELRSAPKSVEVTFLNLHYDCQQGEWQYPGDDGERHPIWGYRSFQVDMYIRNGSDRPIQPPWRPIRWVITDGQNDSVSSLTWAWRGREDGVYEPPAVEPGDTVGWTFMCLLTERNQWVRQVDYLINGEVYSQEFDLGPYGNAYNYRDCGEPRVHDNRPTPTPWP